MYHCKKKSVLRTCYSTRIRHNSDYGCRNLKPLQDDPSIRIPNLSGMSGIRRNSRGKGKEAYFRCGLASEEWTADKTAYSWIRVERRNESGDCSIAIAITNQKQT